MNTTMADGASERLDAQVADALFGQPGMSKLDVTNRLRQLRGTGAPLLADVGNPVSVSLDGQGNALAKITVAQCPPGMSSDYAYGWNDCINALPAPPADDAWHLQGYAYASKQATTCAGCGQHKHTPLRIDAMGGYVCLTCIDARLSGMLGELGYPETHTAPGRWTQRHSEQLYDALNKGLTIHVGALSQKKRDAISAEVKRALIDGQTGACEPITASNRLTDTAQAVALEALQGVAAEYQRWIEFHSAGNGDYDDFRRKDALTNSQEVQP